MNKNIPKIIIKYNRFLDPIFIAYVKSIPKWKDWTPPEKEVVLKRIKNYREEWKKYEKEILDGMSDVLKMDFKRNIIDVHIVSGNPRQFSRPIIIKSGLSLDEFVDTLTHELIHVLFQDNNDIFPVKILSNMFPDESELARNHIITHSVLKHIYINILKDETRLEKNITRSKDHGTNDYSRAWEIVEERGYRELIEGLIYRIKKNSSS